MPPRAEARPHRELTVAEIAKLTHAQLTRQALPERRIRNIASLQSAGIADLAFLDDAKHAAELAVTRAGACFVLPGLAALAPSGLVVLVTDDPYSAFVTVARALFPESLRPSSVFEGSGVAAGAQVHASARVETGTVIDPLAVIGPRAEIGTGTVIGAGAAIGFDVCIGRQCAVGPGATILHALIGDRVVIHPGARIGQDGSGYLPGPRQHCKIPQTRRVIVQDEVAIGANSAIERGALRDTVIGEGTKIDNLVEIAQDVSIGRHCLIAAQTGIARGVTVGDFAMIGERVGIAGHVVIGAGAIIAAQSVVRTDVAAHARIGGAPAEGPEGGVP